MIPLKFTFVPHMCFISLSLWWTVLDRYLVDMGSQTRPLVLSSIESDLCACVKVSVLNNFASPCVPSAHRVTVD